MATSGGSLQPRAVETPVSRALSAAVLASQRTRHAIANEVHINYRTLLRYLSGQRVPDYEVRDRILLACGAQPATSLLSAELGLDALIGSGWGCYLDVLVPALYIQARASADDGIQPIDPRWATKHIKIFVAIWEAVHRKHQIYLDQLAAENGHDRY